MSVTMNWVDDSQTVIHFMYEGNWQWDHAFAAVEESKQMMNEVNHKVASIVDLTQGQHLPEGAIQALEQIVQNRSTHPNDSGVTIFLNAEPLTKAMLDVLTIGNPQATQFATFTYAKSIDEAIAKARRDLVPQ